jgi:hypothetical protein
MRTALVAAAATVLVLIPASASRGGGMSSFEFEQDYVLTGETVTGRSTFYTDARATGRVENGPWHGYLLPAGTWIEPPTLPEGATDVGPIAIEDRGDGRAVASITFTVPEVTTGGYFIGLCNVPCTEAFDGDLGGGWLSIAQTEEGASLLRKLDTTEHRLDRSRNRLAYRLAGRISDVERPLEELESRLDRVEGSIELRLDRLESRLRTSLAADQGSGAAPWVTPLSAAAVVAFAVTLLLRRRGHPRPHPVPQEPPVVEWEIPEEVSART